MSNLPKTKIKMHLYFQKFTNPSKGVRNVQGYRNHVHVTRRLRRRSQ